MARYLSRTFSSMFDLLIYCSWENVVGVPHKYQSLILCVSWAAAAHGAEEITLCILGNSPPLLNYINAWRVYLQQSFHSHRTAQRIAGGHPWRKCAKASVRKLLECKAKPGYRRRLFRHHEANIHNPEGLKGLKTRKWLLYVDSTLWGLLCLVGPSALKHHRAAGLVNISVLRRLLT